jgi:hypothetical protein
MMDVMTRSTAPRAPHKNLAANTLTALGGLWGGTGLLQRQAHHQWQHDRLRMKQVRRKREEEGRRRTAAVMYT